jgi:catechol 2,3-dioxygenase-like lactoylglutathione lyase family enzyme
MTDPAARVTGLAHVTIRTADLATTIAFYERVIGLRQVARPPFPFPGAWLGFGDDALVHLIGGDRARDADGRVPRGTGAIDHVSFWARGYAAQRERLDTFRLPFRESCPPETTLAQIFVFDPNGVLIELTYDLRDEAGAVPGRRNDRLQWDPAHYAQFGGITGH